MYEWQNQPFKGVYLAYEALTTALIRLPCYCLRYVLRRLRPRPTWSYRMSVLVPLMRHWFPLGKVSERAGQFQSWYRHDGIPEVANTKSVWLEARPELVVGEVREWARAAGVESVRIPGYWLDRMGEDTGVSAKAGAGEKVIYYMHGGCFMSESAHPTNFMAVHPRMFMQRCPAAKRAFSIEYRICDLGATTTNPFPAALVDCVLGFHYLTNTLGFTPDHIFIAGDSAGANLAQALARYLIYNRTQLAPLIPALAPPRPVSAGLILLSPWADLGTSHETPRSTIVASTHDVLPDPRAGLMLAARKAYLGPLGFAGANANPYLSPGSTHAHMSAASFAGFPRTAIVSGDVDRFFDETVSLRDKMVRDIGAGTDGVTFIHGVDGTHGFLLVFSDEPVGQKALAALEQWLA